MSLRRLTLVVAVALIAAGIGFFAVARWRSGARGGLAADTAAATGGEVAAGPAAAGESSEVRRQPVTIYQRAQTDGLALAGAEAEIVWLDSPVDRARQVVQLVLEGVPGSSGTLPPAPVGVRYRDVRIGGNGVAWVDFDGSTLGGLGSDHEQALVGALARSLTEAFPDEIRRVGVLVDGMPARSLAGHVDTSRPFTGREFPVAGGDGPAAGGGDSGGGAGAAQADPAVEDPRPAEADPAPAPAANPA